MAEADTLTQEQIDALLNDEPSFPVNRYRHLKPLSEAADNYVTYIQNPEGRFRFGLDALDSKLRGIGRGELCFITAKPHEGKTQLVINAIVNNPERRVLVWTFDEVAELVLAKLIAIKYGVSGEALEERVKAYDPDALRMVRRAADEDFKNLIVLDQPMGIREMADSLKEAEDYWGDRCELGVLDYLDQLRGDVDVAGTVGKANKIKVFTKQANLPMVVLHQGSRGAGPRGQSAGMELMRHGGDDAATFVIECYRRRGDKTLDAWEQQRHANTVTYNIVKNKRPPCHVGETTYFIDPATGLIRELDENDFGGFVQSHEPDTADRMRSW